MDPARGDRVSAKITIYCYKPDKYLWQVIHEDGRCEQGELLDAINCEGEVTVILGLGSVCVYHLEALTKLSNRQQRQALPLALEEQLASPIIDCHYLLLDDGRVIVCQHRVIEEILSDLALVDIQPDYILPCLIQTEDQCAQVWVIGGLCAIRTGHKQLICDYSNLSVFIENIPGNVNQAEIIIDKEEIITELSKHVCQAHNLLIGPYRTARKRNRSRIMQSAFVICSITMMLWCMNIFIERVYFKENLAQIEKQIAKLYQSEFPRSAVSHTPVLQFKKKLYDMRIAHQDDQLLLFLDKIDSVASQVTVVKVMHVDYASGKLMIQLTSDDLVAFTRFKKLLAKAGCRIKQAQAATVEGTIQATINISIPRRKA